MASRLLTFQLEVFPMYSRTAALLIAGALATGGMAPDVTAQDQPVFRVVVVGRSTPAINYRPRNGETKIDFVGTPLSPQARGDATIKGEKGYIEIDANFENLQAPSRFGPEYLTYVVWAVTPEGRPTNLGELQVSGDDGELRVTTELQAFGLIVTAEPYFAVTQPSDVVVMENAPRQEGVFQDKTIGKVEVVQAKYELLKRGTYLMNQDPSRLKIKPLEPGAPLDLAEARNAVELARLAGADRHAAETFAKATQLLAEAEQAREQRRNRNMIMQPARQAAQTAEDARLIALQRQEEEFNANQRKLAAEREAAARAQAEAEAARRAQAENDRLKAEADRLAAERERQAADAARAAAERARAAADLESQRLAQERQAAEAARLAAEAQAQQARTAAAQAEAERAELRDRLRQQLNQVLETRETARGLIVNLSDVLFDFNSANLKPGAREKLARVSGILLTTPGLTIEVEGHTDSVGSDGYNQRLSEQRAASVRDYLLRQGIMPDAVATSGLGESQPVVSNATPAGRQQNRRVELVVSGEAIGTTTTTTTTTSSPAR
jgi:outer membrane protein OmpA-like peptidoglycan-associated protein